MIPGREEMEKALKERHGETCRKNSTLPQLPSAVW